MFLRTLNNLLLPLGTWRRSFFVTLFFVTVATSLFWLESYRAYESEIRVLVIGKSPGIAIDQVVENFAEMTSNLSFYERVLAENDLIDDSFEGYSKDTRKALWNEVVTVKRSDGSGVLTVTAKQDTSEKSKMFAEATVNTLFSLAGFYYNIKTDIDLRVVDETIVKTVLRSPVQYVFVSFGSALGLTILFFWFLTITPFFFRKKKGAVSPVAVTNDQEHVSTKEHIHQMYAIGEAVPYIDPQKFIPARPMLTFGSSHEEQQIREEVSRPIDTKIPDATTTLSSERMLPGMDVEALPFEFEERPEDEQKSILSPSIDETSLPKTVVPEVELGEPTIEEYKRRLNELLRGGK